MRRGCAPWRRWLAALLCVLVASYTIAATAAQIAAATDPEICIAPSAGAPGDAGSGTAHAIKCLLCLPGCTALGMAPPPAFAPPAARAGTAIAASAIVAGTARIHVPYAPRGPPARA